MKDNSKIKVLMLGWEFPPYFKGGLGIHCYHLSKKLGKKVDLKFVVPFKNRIKEKIPVKFFKLSIVKPRLNLKDNTYSRVYPKHLINYVKRYPKYAKKIIRENKFDLIHAQDWLPLLAALKVKKLSKKPLIVTCHSTEFDKSKIPRKYRYNIEKMAFEQADKVITVSNYTKSILIKKYKINPKKITTIYNGISVRGKSLPVKKRSKIVLFLGRIVYQKGLDILLKIIKFVVKKDNTIVFHIVGKGSRNKKLLQKVKDMRIDENVKILGYVLDKDRCYRGADIFVMPSVSEPFGMTPLEAIKNGTPVIISKQSGVSEILKNSIKIDYWNIEKWGNSILKLMKDKKLYNKLRRNGFEEVKKFTWERVADNTVNVYKKLLKVK